jgi:hypothetical protein
MTVILRHHENNRRSKAYVESVLKYLPHDHKLGTRCECGHGQSVVGVARG